MTDRNMIKDEDEVFIPCDANGFIEFGKYKCYRFYELPTSYLCWIRKKVRSHQMSLVRYPKLAEHIRKVDDLLNTYEVGQ